MKKRLHYLSRTDYEGVGNYEYQTPMGGFGQLPAELDILTKPVAMSGLNRVPPQLEPQVVSALETLQFEKAPTPPTGGKVTGMATYEPGQPPSPWVTNLVNQGHVVMVNASDQPIWQLDVAASNDPETVVLLAGGPESDYVVVSADPAALAAAEAYALGEQPGSFPQGDCPQGQVKVGTECLSTPPCGPGEEEYFGVCFPAITPPGTQPPGEQPPEKPTDKAQPQEEDGLPGWVLPAAIGAGVLAIGGYLITRGGGKRRRAPARTGAQQMAANRRHAYPPSWR